MELKVVIRAPTLVLSHEHVKIPGVLYELVVILIVCLGLAISQDPRRTP